MSATNARKPPVPTAPGRMSPSPNRGSQSASTTTPRGASKNANGLGRSPSFKDGSPISARAAVRKPGVPSASTPSKLAKSDERDEADNNSSATIEELEANLQSANEQIEDLRKQLEGSQTRLEEQTAEHNKLEEQMHEGEEKNEGLQNEIREITRQKRELENIYEADRAAFMKEQEAAQLREDQQQQTIQRLKDGLSEKEQVGTGSPNGRLSRNTSSPSLDTPHFAPSSALSRSNSRNNSKLILQKDKVIESLRLELAEAQIKLVEMENMGGGQMQVLEKSLLEARMANARLMEDNESYQLLLSEKTLNGDFTRQDILHSHSPAATDRTPPRLTRTSTLADELALSTSAASAEVPGFFDDNTDRDRRHLQAELTSLKDQNKALTVYINKIIERILQRQGGFENILSTADDADDDDEPPAVPQKDKELPPPPPREALGTSPSAGGSFLERAKSVMSAGGRPNPPSPNKAAQPSITDDPNTAPSIPLTRKTSQRKSAQFNRRATVDWSNSPASVISNMYKGPTTSDGQVTTPGLAPQRNSFFAFGAGARMPSNSTIPKAKDENTKPGESTRASEGAEAMDAKSARQAALDALEGDTVTPATSVSDAPSPGRSSASSEAQKDKGGPSVMMGSRMRPLRLVQEKEEDDAARKAANRASWMPTGWFGGAKDREGSA